MSGGCKCNHVQISVVKEYGSTFSLKKGYVTHEWTENRAFYRTTGVVHNIMATFSPMGGI